VAGGECCAKDGGKLAAAEVLLAASGSAWSPAGEPCINASRSRQASVVETGAAPGPTLSPSPSSAGKRRRSRGVADHLAEADEIGAAGTASYSAATASTTRPRS
jgi:hypothetical protein